MHNSFCNFRFLTGIAGILAPFAQSALQKYMTTKLMLLISILMLLIRMAASTAYSVLQHQKTCVKVLKVLFFIGYINWPLHINLCTLKIINKRSIYVAYSGDMTINKSIYCIKI